MDQPQTLTGMPCIIAGKLGCNHPVDIMAAETRQIQLPPESSLPEKIFLGPWIERQLDHIRFMSTRSQFTKQRAHQNFLASACKRNLHSKHKNIRQNPLRKNARDPSASTVALKLRWKAKNLPAPYIPTHLYD